MGLTVEFANVLKSLSFSDLQLRITVLENLLSLHQGSLATICQEEIVPASIDSESLPKALMPWYPTLPASEAVPQDMALGRNLLYGKQP